MTFEQFGYLEKNGILAFHGGPLCQWWNKQSSFFMGDLRYKSVGQYKEANKANLFFDFDKEEEILLESDPIVNKKQGREIKNFNQEIWDAHVRSFIFWGTLMKFRQNSHLREFFIETKDLILIEASENLTWGCGLTLDSKDLFNKNKWIGGNLHSEILKDVRDVILTD